MPLNGLFICINKKKHGFLTNQYQFLGFNLTQACCADSFSNNSRLENGKQKEKFIKTANIRHFSNKKIFVLPKIAVVVLPPKIKF